ncbi:MAG: transposase domain-containing protein [Bacilli bacterium]|nr:transposase domain-containing protein [Bacilli bacterium]
MYFSIQQTARANGFEPADFVIMLLEKLRPTSTIEEIDSLMPWEINKPRTNE